VRGARQGHNQFTEHGCANVSDMGNIVVGHGSRLVSFYIPHSTTQVAAAPVITSTPLADNDSAAVEEPPEQVSDTAIAAPTPTSIPASHSVLVIPVIAANAVKDSSSPAPASATAPLAPASATAPPAPASATAPPAPASATAPATHTVETTPPSSPTPTITTRIAAHTPREVDKMDSADAVDHRTAPPVATEEQEPGAITSAIPSPDTPVSPALPALRSHWSSQSYMAAGTYRFVVQSGQGVRVYLDDTCVFDGLDGAVQGNSATTVTFAEARTHSIRVEMYEGSGYVQTHFRWEWAGR
jgi:hypothetical protein